METGFAKSFAGNPTRRAEGRVIRYNFVLIRYWGCERD